MTDTTRPDTPAPAGLAELVARARSGDRDVLPELRAFLDARPDVWREVGDLAAHALEAWVGVVAGPDLVLAESVRRRIDGLRAELSGPSPTPLEELLVERVLACWLQVSHADAAAAQARGPHATGAVRAELLRRQESGQRRYLAAVKQLAVVRRLRLPATPPAGSTRSALRLAGGG